MRGIMRMLKISISGKNPKRVTAHSKKFKGRKIAQGVAGGRKPRRTPQRLRLSTGTIFAQGIGLGNGGPTRIVTRWPIRASSRESE
jgi:hypothetical protein